MFRFFLFVFKQKTAYEVRISDWSSDVCSSDLRFEAAVRNGFAAAKRRFRMRALLTAMVIALLFSAMTLIMWDAVHDVASGQLTGGSLAAFVFTAGTVAGAFQAVTEVHGELLRASGAAGRLSEPLADRTHIPPPPPT